VDMVEMLGHEHAVYERARGAGSRTLGRAYRYRVSKRTSHTCARYLRPAGQGSWPRNSPRDETVVTTSPDERFSVVLDDAGASVETAERRRSVLERATAVSEGPVPEGQ
jgi:mannose/cellobiose epimerase-like protein (N-acyl-D-glucosamine 2-epimerase family)